MRTAFPSWLGRLARAFGMVGLSTGKLGRDAQATIEHREVFGIAVKINLDPVFQ